MRIQIIFAISIAVAAALFVCPTETASRWFTASYQDLRATFHRYGHCVNGLTPLKEANMSETDYLIQRIRVFLDQANYDNEQLLNISALMDLICYGQDAESNYPISVHINVDKYANNVTGKTNRCRAIDEAMNSMFNVFKRSAFNKSEPLDFSIIHFYPDATNKTATYNLTDLINTSWIKSDTMVESVCNITNSVKEYVSIQTSNSTAQARSQQQHSSILNTLIEFMDRLLNPILGLQKRLYWESNNRLEIAYSMLGSQLSSLRKGLGRTYNSTRERITNVFSVSTPSTNSSIVSLSTPVPAFNLTKLN